MMTRVKICCIASIEEARMAIDFGASAIGLVGEMPSGPGVIGNKRIIEIARNVPPPVSTFLLTSRTQSSEIVEHYRQTQTAVIQIVDQVDTQVYKYLKQEIGHIKLVQVVHVLNERSLDEAEEVSKYVDAVLLDSGNPFLEVKQLGGTGRTHNWEISRRIVENLDIPVFLAGGLNSTNIQEAIETVQPFGVDLCSGVRTRGRLDPFKLEKFFLALQGF